MNLGNLLDQRQSVHLGHIDVGEHQVYVRLFLQPVECFQAIMGKDELVEAGANITAHSLKHEPFEIRLIVHDQYFVFPTHLLIYPAPGEPIALPETPTCLPMPDYQFWEGVPLLGGSTASLTMVRSNSHRA